MATLIWCWSMIPEAEQQFVAEGHGVDRRQIA
jgi:hypothetical protein